MHTTYQDICFSPRICIVGSPCSGKSTLSNRLQLLLGYPIIRMNDISTELSNKLGRDFSKKEWCSLLRQKLEKKEWITDGYYTDSLDIRFELAETIIFLDIPKGLCIRRAIKRGWENLFGRAETVHSNYNRSFKARITYLFGPRIYNRIHDFHANRKAILLDKLDQYPEKLKIIYNSQELEYFFQNTYNPLAKPFNN